MPTIKSTDDSLHLAALALEKINGHSTPTQIRAACQQAALALQQAAADPTTAPTLKVRLQAMAKQVQAGLKPAESLRLTQQVEQMRYQLGPTSRSKAATKASPALALAFQALQELKQSGANALKIAAAELGQAAEAATDASARPLFEQASRLLYQGQNSPQVVQLIKRAQIAEQGGASRSAKVNKAATPPPPKYRVGQRLVIPAGTPMGMGGHGTKVDMPCEVAVVDHAYGTGDPIYTVYYTKKDGKRTTTTLDEHQLRTKSAKAGMTKFSQEYGQVTDVMSPLHTLIDQLKAGQLPSSSAVNKISGQLYTAMQTQRPTTRKMIPVLTKARQALESVTPMLNDKAGVAAQKPKILAGLQQAENFVSSAVRNWPPEQEYDIDEHGLPNQIPGSRRKARTDDPQIKQAMVNIGLAYSRLQAIQQQFSANTLDAATSYCMRLLQPILRGGAVSAASRSELVEALTGLSGVKKSSDLRPIMQKLQDAKMHAANVNKNQKDSGKGVKMPTKAQILRKAKAMGAKKAGNNPPLNHVSAAWIPQIKRMISATPKSGISQSTATSYAHNCETLMRSMETNDHSAASDLEDAAGLYGRAASAASAGSRDVPSADRYAQRAVQSLQQALTKIG